MQKAFTRYLLYYFISIFKFCENITLTITKIKISIKNLCTNFDLFYLMDKWLRLKFYINVLNLYNNFIYLLEYNINSCLKVIKY